MENRFDKALVKFFNEQARRLSNKYKQLSQKQEITKSEATQLANNTVENMADWEEESRRLLLALFPLYIQAGELGNELANLTIGLTGENALLYNIIEESYLEFLNRYGAAQVVRVTDSTKDIIKRKVRDGILSGASEKDIAATIQASVEEIGFNRAKTIARTETHNTFMKARELNANEYGFKYWMWLTSEDERVRGNDPMDQFSHVINDRVVVQIGDLFPSGITRPGDPAGEPGNIINCRCEIVPVTEAEYLAYIQISA